MRTAASNRIQSAVNVAADAFLWLAALQLNEKGERPEHPTHRNGASRKRFRPSGAHHRRLGAGAALRCELWRDQLDPQSFSHFTSSPPADANAQKLAPSLSDATLTAA